MQRKSPNERSTNYEPFEICHVRGVLAELYEDTRRLSRGSAAADRPFASLAWPICPEVYDGHPEAATCWPHELERRTVQADANT